MCRGRCIFIPLLAVLALFLVARHRHIHRMTQVPFEPLADDGAHDVAALLRTLDPHSNEAVPQDKQWARQFAQFINSHPGGQWVVGRCDRPCLSEAEASDSAHADGARRIYPVIRQRISVARRDDGWLRDRITKDVREGRLDADRFAEQFSRPYGQVWAESVLLDVSPDRMAPLVRGYSMELSRRHARAARHVMAAVVLTIVLFGLYFLLNSITQGYFSGRLRLATIAIIVMGAIILLR